MLIETSRIINAPPAAIWQIFGEGFGDIADWATVILKSELDRPLEQGAVRTCQLKDGPITEELVRFDRDERALTYVIRSGLPGMMKSAENAWTLEDMGDNQTRVTSRITAQLAWWALPLTPVVRGQFGGTIQGLLKQLDEATLAAG